MDLMAMGYCLKYGLIWVSEVIRHIHKIKNPLKDLEKYHIKDYVCFSK